jgi:hypothetical protein
MQVSPGWLSSIAAVLGAHRYAIQVLEASDLHRDELIQRLDGDVVLFCDVHLLELGRRNAIVSS